MFPDIIKMQHWEVNDYFHKSLYDFLWWYFVGTRVNQVDLLFFSHLIYLPEHILIKKKNGCDIQTKRAKNSKLAQKRRLFSSFPGQKVQVSHVYHI